MALFSEHFQQSWSGPIPWWEFSCTWGKLGRRVQKRLLVVSIGAYFAKCTVKFFTSAYYSPMTRLWIQIFFTRGAVDAKIVEENIFLRVRYLREKPTVLANGASFTGDVFVKAIIFCASFAILLLFYLEFLQLLMNLLYEDFLIFDLLLLFLNLFQEKRTGKHLYVRWCISSRNGHLTLAT